MTDQTITLDLAQQIAEAMSRTDEPKQHDRGPQICEDFNVFGSVPPHLRHLHNLMLEASDKFYLDTSGHESEAKLDFLKFVFFTSLQEHVKIPPGTPYAICEGWEVIELKAGCM